MRTQLPTSRHIDYVRTGQNALLPHLCRVCLAFQKLGAIFVATKIACAIDENEPNQRAEPSQSTAIFHNFRKIKKKKIATAQSAPRKCSNTCLFCKKICSRKKFTSNAYRHEFIYIYQLCDNLFICVARLFCLPF